jgi:hypothetical protein
MKKLLLVLLVAFPLMLKATDSCSLRISVITCSPGLELYSIFGHSALRITDSLAETDIVYNYGTFDAGDPDFYIKFLKGKMNYFLSQQDFRNFAYSYYFDQRGVSEQELHLSCEEKHRFQQYVFHNMEADKRFYKYDFFYDNCTTRIRDMVEKLTNKSYAMGNIPQATHLSFRSALHYYLDKGNMPWSKLGIDILLGISSDKEMTTREAMFLPDFLESSIDHANYNKQPLVKEKATILKQLLPQGDGAMQIPFIIFSAIALVIFVVGLFKNKFFKTLTTIFDYLLFFSIGLLGAVLLFMWFGTDHTVMGKNLNLLWAWPLHILVVFFMYSKYTFIKKYFLGYAILQAIILLFWRWLPQSLNPALIPIVLITTWRSWNIYKR